MSSWPGISRCAPPAVAALLLAAACGGKRADPPVLVPWHRVGDISLGESRAQVEAEYGKETSLGYHLHGSRVYVEFEDGKVDGIRFSTPYYRTTRSFGVGSRIPTARHRWHGFVWNAWERERPCGCWVKVGDGAQSLPVTAKNFLKPWTFIYAKHGRVTAFYFARRFVD